MKSLALALCAALSLPFSAFAQEAPAAEEPSLFGEVIDVRVVNVEAVVTDKAGQRVRDLKAGDFKLRVDGVEVPIGFFSEVREGVSVGAADGGSTMNVCRWGTVLTVTSRAAAATAAMRTRDQSSATARRCCGAGAVVSTRGACGVAKLAFSA